MVFRQLTVGLLALAASASALTPTALSDLTSLTDAELTELYKNPVPGLPPIPSAATPDQWDQCKGATFVNILTQKSADRPGPFPNMDFGNSRLWGVAWYGKTFRTSAATGETYLWNLLMDEERVAVTARTYILPTGFLNDGIPSIGMNYSLSEIPASRAFFGEMRYLGNQIYLGKQFVVNPAFTTVKTGQVVADPTPAPFPVFVTYFGLHCGSQPPAKGYTQIALSKISGDILNSLFNYFPKGYKLPEPVPGK